MKSEKISTVKKIASIAGITVASILIIIAFSGRFCTSEGARGFMHFANFFLGAFGMSFYGMMAAVIIACACTLAGKTIRMPVKYIIHFVLLFVAVTILVHMLTTTYLPSDFNSHMSLIYHYYDNELGVPSFGGVVFGLFAWCLQPLTIWGASIVVGALLAWTVYVAGDFFYKYSTGKLLLASKPTKADIEPTETTADSKDRAVYPNSEHNVKSAYEILFVDPIEESAKPEVVTSKDTSTSMYDYADRSEVKNQPTRTSTPEDAKQFLFSDNPTTNKSDDNSFFAKETSTREDDYLVKGYQKPLRAEDKPAESSSDWKISSVPAEEIKTVEEQPQERRAEYHPIEQPKEEPKVVQQPQSTQSSPFVEMPLDDYDTDIDITEVTADEEEIIEIPIQQKPVQTAPVQPTIEYPKQSEIVTSQPKAVEPVETKKYTDEIFTAHQSDETESGTQFVYDSVSRQEDSDNAKSQVHQYMEYNVPPLDLLNDATIVEDHDDGERERLAQAIVNKLSVFNIKIELADIIVGPTVTRYMFTVLSQKTRMSDFKQYAGDIKACVEAQEDIIIEAPVKGTNMVGIEVANKVKHPVVLRALLDTPDFQNAKGDLVFAIGQEVSGKVVLADLADMPHLLIAGTTGSGKSVCLNCLIVSLMYKYGPEYLRFVMVDPKFVELSRYNGIPHMLTTETITTMQDALACMDYLIAEMESRYQLFRQNGVDKISEYNKRVNPKLAQKLPYLVFVVDELADLMATNKSAFEAKLMRLAQKARAAGIHIVLATQRPDVKVITGTIKGNLPCRMALKVSSVYDSQTIIGGGGAEKLLGKGDMLFMNSSGSSDLTRVQGAYISNDEIRSLVKYSVETNEVYYDTSISKEIFVSRVQEEEKRREEETSHDEGGKDELYPYYKKALRYWLERNNGKASISSIQRGINVGFNRAGRIMENLQKMGYVEELSSSETSNRALKVLVTLEELDSLFPDVED